ncbi:hypothetical protein SmJEL517_g05077 [Synchytrium microbalum]|uniref:C2 domain-containing protein n=1 Tax=Synchytrium microbalum TaxID=1806994 RepID=A0A507BW03_9FUNG|nr:uncharacterized protein SmJEL517_g05077 [Synchytrium microbalum]TPX31652.1 hypothetical protein SmJEL517_g05077 [Synchytrium microbalum]
MSEEESHEQASSPSLWSYVTTPFNSFNQEPVSLNLTNQIHHKQVLRSLLYPVNQAGTSPNGLRSRSSSTNITTTATMVPPDRPLCPPPSNSRLQLANVIREALDVDDAEFQDTKAVLLETFGSDTVQSELGAYNVLLGSDAAFIKPTDFDSPAKYAAWKTAEQADMVKLALLTATSEPRALFSVTVVEAVDIMAKDKNGASNPYLAIFTEDRTFVSHAVQKSVDPVWNFTVTIPMTKSSDPFFISIWNRPGGARGPISPNTKESFLGMMELDFARLVEGTKNGATLSLKLPLSKRNKRSHVTGTIHIVVDRVAQAEKAKFCTIPYEPRLAYTALAQMLLQHDLRKASPALSVQSREILLIVASIWRISAQSSCIILFELATALFIEKRMETLPYYQIFFSPAMALTRVDTFTIKDTESFMTTLRGLHLVLNGRLSDMFTDRITKEQGDSVTTILVMYIKNSTLIPRQVAELITPIKTTIHNALEARFIQLHTTAESIGAKGAQGADLHSLVTLLTGDLQGLVDNLDGLLLERMHVPTMAAIVFYERLSLELDAYAADPEPDLDDAFALCRAVVKLRVAYESIDHRLADKFRITYWFIGAVRAWLAVTERKIHEWAQNAVAFDKFLPISPEEGILHSTSVIDLFTSFQQQVDFFVGIGWPDVRTERVFVSRLVEIFTEAIERYSNILRRRIIGDFEIAEIVKTASKEPLPIKSEPPATIGMKINFKMPKILSKKVQLGEDDVRVLSTACVKLNDLHHMPERLEYLVKRLPESSTGPIPDDEAAQNNPSLPPRKPNRDALPRPPLRITVVRGEYHPCVRPLATELCIAIYANGLELARTRRILQRVRPVWHESLHLVSGRGALEICLIHCLPEGQEYIMSRSVLDFPDTGGDQTVLLSPFGRVQLKVEVGQTDAVEFALERAKWVCAKAENAAIDDFVKTLCHDLRPRIKDCCKRHKRKVLADAFKAWVPTKLKMVNSSGFLGSMNGGSGAKTPPSVSDSSSVTNMDEEEVEMDLAPVLGFLNSNLRVMSSSMYDDLGNKVIRRIWDRFVRVCEGLLVPPLGEDGKDKKPWDEARVAWMRQAVEIFRDFFHSDGDGLPVPVLHTARYMQLTLTMEHYFYSKNHMRDFVAKYLQDVRVDGGDSSIAGNEGLGVGGVEGQPDGPEWALRLVKLWMPRGDSVDNILRAWIEMKAVILSAAETSSA